MSPRNDSPEESLASPDEPVDENLPGDMLAEDLADPEPYEVAADESEAEELQAGDAASDDGIDDPNQLVTAETAAARARSARPRRRVPEPAPAEPAPTGKGKRKRGPGRPAGSRRATPKRFVEESVEELRKVVWPTWSQVQQLFWAVLVLVLIVIAYVSLLDLGFGWGLLQLFGRRT